MSGLRSPLFLGLMLLLLTAGYCKEDTEDTEDSSALFRLVMDTVARLRQDRAEQDTGLLHHSRKRGRSSQPGPDHDYTSSQAEHVIEIFPRDLRTKEKFLKHLTGPLYFSPKCSKHFYRLYHNTRDCTIPAYYKRCARLLTRLAGSPRCMEG
ncbi:ALK and LTK ligand 2b [Amia ocellicauda]|uniref:ALK and LTK ligand 2b n=1 Tax=Amia ocellicauda TaxID=2972642 RepID=UPI003464BDA5